MRFGILACEKRKKTLQKKKVKGNVGGRENARGKIVMQTQSSAKERKTDN